MKSRTLVYMLVVVAILSACRLTTQLGGGAAPAAPSPAASPQLAASTTGDTPTPASTLTPSPNALPAATFTPTIPPPAVIGLDNFNQLVTLHEYGPDIEAVIHADSDSPYAAFAPVYSPDSQHFATAISLPDGTRALLVLEVATGDLVASVPLAEGVTKVYSFNFSPDGQQLLYATLSTDGTGQISIWDISAQKLNRILWSKKGDSASDTAFSPDGKQIIAVIGSRALNGRGKSLAVWDAVTGDLLKQLPADAQYGVDIGIFSADGRRLILSTQAGGKELAVYDTSTWKTIALIHPAGNAAEVAAISPDGGFVVTTEQEDEDILLWDASTGELISGLKNPFEVTDGMVFSPDGFMLVVSGTPPFAPHTDAMYLDAAIWDTSTWKQVGIQHWGKTDSLRFSPDGRSLLAHYEETIYAIGFPDAEIQNASQTAVDFTAALGRGDYAAAASRFSIKDLERENLENAGLASDPATILQTICHLDAFPCLPATVIYSSRVRGEVRGAPGFYELLVQFTKLDGSVYSDVDGATIFALFLSPGPDGIPRVDALVYDVVAVMQE